MSLLFDLLIVLLLVLFAWRGASKGLILSLLGLAAVFVAFFGARVLSTLFCGPVANIIRPVVETNITKAVEEGIRHGSAGVATRVEDARLNDILAALRETEMFQGLTQFLKEAIQSDALKQGASSAIQVVARYLSLLIARLVLFAFFYIAIVVAWFLVSHMLDLTFHLPILTEVNMVGGLLFGLVKGVLLIIVLVWLGQVSGVVPNQPDTPILSLFTVERLNDLLAKLPA